MYTCNQCEQLVHLDDFSDEEGICKTCWAMIECRRCRKLVSIDDLSVPGLCSACWEPALDELRAETAAERVRLNAVLAANDAAAVTN